jgi:hypothetical protein
VHERWSSRTTLPLPTHHATRAGGQAASSQLRAPGGGLVAGRVLGDAEQRRAAGRRLQCRQPRGQVSELVCARRRSAPQLTCTLTYILQRSTADRSSCTAVPMYRISM